MGAEKPPLPDSAWGDWQRIPVDQGDGSAFGDVLRIGTFAADRWTLGDDGPYRKPGQTSASVVRAQIREALLHLLELGLIDIDEERLRTAKAWPMDRQSATEKP